MTPKRAVVRPLASAAVAVGLIVWAGAAPALAATPEAWSDADNDSFFVALLKLGGAALILFVLIWLAVYLPSILRSGKFDESTAFVDEPEWFGGPTSGTDAAKAQPEGSETGGSGANW